MKTTKQTILAASIAAAISFGCSSVPKPVVPDGSGRVSVNSQEKIQEFKSRTSEEQANYNERSALARQVEALNRQVAEMKTYLAVLAYNKELDDPKPKKVIAETTKTKAHVKASPAKSADTQPVAVLRAAPSIALPGAATAPTTASQAPAVVPIAAPMAPKTTPDKANIAPTSDAGTIEVRPDSVIFRVRHEFAKTEFVASDELKTEILRAAREGKNIELRGRTDSEKINSVDRDIALNRALKARLFLVRSGIDPHKIRITYLSAGDFVADNTTAAGKALNRRVELEMKQINTAAFANKMTLALGDAK